MITTAPVRFLDSSARYDRSETAVRVEGRWYHAISETGESSGQAIFYQDRDSRLVDMIRVPCAHAGKSFMVRGYDYRKIEKEGPLSPTRIELFSTGAEGDLQKRLVKIDCHTTVRAK
ncbi:MAG: hypothetical protein A2Z25_12695 [Planctomycetes bacterium RBG_16_55_9]|nr:MAG: hypothetical protein A2Z25_12695 [Planctomycetes bacterium RBG_16_55_9]